MSKGIGARRRLAGMVVCVATALSACNGAAAEPSKATTANAAEKSKATTANVAETGTPGSLAADGLCGAGRMKARSKKPLRGDEAVPGLDIGYLPLKGLTNGDTWSDLAEVAPREGLRVYGYAWSNDDVDDTDPRHRLIAVGVVCGNLDSADDLNALVSSAKPGEVREHAAIRWTGDALGRGPRVMWLERPGVAIFVEVTPHYNLDRIVAGIKVTGG
jgi:hypothetical protein